MAADLEMENVRARARAAYERGRARDASFVAAFVPPLAFVVGLYEHEVRSCLVVGVVLAALVALLHWRGRDLARGVVPGALAGVAPLVLSNVVRSAHLCIGGSCTSACIAACAVGGLAAGLGSAWFARRASLSLVGWLGAASVAGLVGALGCVCVGVFGVVGLIGGLLVGAAPLVLRPVAAH